MTHVENFSNHQKLNTGTESQITLSIYQNIDFPVLRPTNQGGKKGIYI